MVTLGCKLPITANPFLNRLLHRILGNISEELASYQDLQQQEIEESILERQTIADLPRRCDVRRGLPQYVVDRV